MRPLLHTSRDSKSTVPRRTYVAPSSAATRVVLRATRVNPWFPHAPPPSHLARLEEHGAKANVRRALLRCDAGSPARNTGEPMVPPCAPSFTPRETRRARCQGERTSRPPPLRRG